MAMNKLVVNFSIRQGYLNFRFENAYTIYGRLPLTDMRLKSLFLKRLSKPNSLDFSLKEVALSFAYAKEFLNEDGFILSFVS